MSAQQQRYDNDCPICLEEDREDIIVLPCGHQIHSVCMAMLATCPICPMCRAEFRFELDLNSARIDSLQIDYDAVFIPPNPHLDTSVNFGGSNIEIDTYTGDTQPLDRGLAEIIQLQPVTFSNNRIQRFFFSAEQTASVLPEIVDGTNIRIFDIIPFLVNAVKEMNSQITKMGETIRSLECIANNN